MASIINTSIIERPVEELWPYLEDPIKSGNLVNTLANIRMEGDIRYGDLPDGTSIGERIISIDKEHYRYSFSVVESPYGFEFHFTSVQLEDLGNGKTKLTFALDCKPDNLNDLLRPQLTAAFADLTNALTNIGK